MQKLFSLIVVLSFLVAAPGVSAQDSELPSPGITPDSPFYFLERISEGIGTFFTFGDLKKAERHAVLAAERLAEAQIVAEKGKPKLTEKTLARYEMQLEKSIARAEKAGAKGQDAEKVTEVMIRVGQATFKHLEVLSEVYEKVPEQAKPAIENAMKASVKGHEKAVEALKTRNALGEVPEEVSLPIVVPAEVRERIQKESQEELEQEKEELEQEKIEQIKERLLKEGSESFEALEALCTKMGVSPEQCAEVEAMCKKVGATTPDECSSNFFKNFFKIEVHTPSSLSEEEMEEKPEEVFKPQEEKPEIPLSYHIENPPYYREDGFCWGASAIILMMNEGFSGDEIQAFRTILKSGPGGPPDMFRGFFEFGIIDKVRIAYSKNYNKQFADFYNQQVLTKPKEQVILLDNQADALNKLKELISSDILVIIIGHHGNHYMVVTGYDENYIYISDPGIDEVFLEKVDYQSEYQEKIKMLTNNFFEQWNISDFEGGGIGFPGDYGIIWLVKQ